VTTPSHPPGLAALNRLTRERYRRHCRPLPRLTMSEWAERYRVLSAEATANHGPWRNDVVPYLPEIMDAISDRETQEVVVVSPSQAAKTETILNAIGYFIHQEPSPLLVVQPTVETGESFSKDRVANMIRDCPALSALVAPARSRESNNTILSKGYPGGQLDITGANAPSGLAMRPKRVILLDERDRHPRSAGSEGDVKAIARARTRSYQRRRKIVEVSSPTDVETSLIWPSYLEGTQEVYEVPCPACDTFQTLHFDRLKWALDDAGKVAQASVAYECAACAHKIPARDKGAVLRAGRWTATATPRVPHKRSFHIHGLTAAFALWEELAQEFVTANTQKDPAMRADMLRAFFNTSLGELFVDQQTETQKDVLRARAKRYDGGGGEDPVAFYVPREAALLTAGVDLQHDRGEIVVRAWGVGETSWLIERVILRGDTSQPAWWAQLEQFRTTRTWRHESGARLMVRAMAIDAGDGTHARQVYQYCAPRLGQHVYAIKGSSNPSAPMIPVKPTRVKPGRLYVIGVHSLMDRLYRRLGMTEPGPGWLYFNDYADEDYVTQLLSMRRKVDEKTRKRVWQATPGVRNEVADCETYAFAALLLGPVPSAQLAAEVDRVNAEGRAAAAPTDAPAPPPPPPIPTPTSSWLRGTGTPRRRGWL
jgi:phage terminase large subunit GpA-like protein